MSRVERIRKLIQLDLNPEFLQIEDETHHHAGHGVVGDETHLAMRVVSEEFIGLSKLQRSRRVYALLDGEFKSGLHAVRLELFTGQEAHLLFQTNK